MEYPTDLALGTDLDIYLDGANDLATISDVEQLEQSVAIDVLDVTRQFIGEELTGASLGLLEERVRQSLRGDEQLGRVQTVNATEYDRGRNTVTLEVVTIENDDFTIEVGA